jgi:hypothetical protein
VVIVADEGGWLQTVNVGVGAAQLPVNLGFAIGFGVLVVSSKQKNEKRAIVWFGFGRENQ